MDFPDGTSWVIPDGWLHLGDLPSHCRSCGARVLWLESKNGKRAPINQDGVNHFATCPDANRWRKR
jgi:hypothetical protein